MNKQSFYESKVKLIGLASLTIMLSLIFGAVAISMIAGIIEMSWVMFVLSIIITIILVPTSLKLISKAKGNEPSVIVSTEGIEINGYIPKIGFIPWEDIDGCVPYSLNGQNFIGFILYDEEKYLKKFTGVNRKILEANRGLGYPVINVSLNTLKEKNSFLEALEEQNVGFYLEKVD
ncbi:STM3941 family protein [Peribacillus asahii]|uniref:STM3941 family protein n=1 Tax=Peribacillus asahii TaxID=228899 RepID=UPI0038278658